VRPQQTAKALNRQRNGDLTLQALDMEEAHRLEGQTFYLPMSMDFRGRVYPLPRFNFQRGDHVRGCSCSRTALRLPKRVHIGYKYTC
jgi:DNA-directed RNA polymerase